MTSIYRRRRTSRAKLYRYNWRVYLCVLCIGFGSALLTYGFIRLVSQP